MQVRWIPDVTSGSSPTINVGGGAKNLKKSDNSTPASSYFTSGTPYNLYYDGTSFLQDPGTSGGSTAPTFADAAHIYAYYKFHDIVACTNGTTITDSSGNGHDGTVVSDGGLLCDGTGFHGFSLSNYVSLPAGLAGSLGAVEIIFDPNSSAYGNGGIQAGIDSANPVIGAASVPSFTIGPYIINNDSNWNFPMTTMLDRFTTAGAGYQTIPFGPHHLAWDFYGGFWLDGKPDLRPQISDISATSQSGAAYKIGSNASTAVKGKIVAILIRTKTALTNKIVTTDLPVMLNNAQAAGAAYPRNPVYPDYTKYHAVFVIGDSICTGNGATRPWQVLPAGMVSSNAPTSGTIVSPGSQGFMVGFKCISGSTINHTAGAGQIYSLVYPFKPYYGTGFVIIAGGTNNLSNGVAADGYTIWDDFVPSMLDQITLAKMVPIVNTLMDRTTTLQTVKNAYNARVREQCGVWDVNSGRLPRCIINDFAADANMGFDGQYSNLTYFSDGTHPTTAGQAILAIHFANVINAYWGTTKSRPSTTLTSGTTAQLYSDTYVPLNPPSGSATTTLPDATGITNSIRRVICLSTAAGTCTVNTTSSQTIISVATSVTTLNLTAGTTAVFMADYGSLTHPINAAAGWVRLPDNQ